MHQRELVYPRASRIFRHSAHLLLVTLVASMVITSQTRAQTPLPVQSAESKQTQPAKVRTSAKKKANGLNVTSVAFGRQGKKLGTYRQTASANWKEIPAAESGNRFDFTETGRDDWSVYLHDPSRDVRIQLDLHRKLVLYSDARNTAPSPLYDIVGASAGKIAATPKTPKQATKKLAPAATSGAVAVGPVINPQPATAPKPKPATQTAKKPDVGSGATATAPTPAPPPTARVVVPANPIAANGWNAMQVVFGAGGQRMGEFRSTGSGRWDEVQDNGSSFHFEETNRNEWAVHLQDRSRNVQLELNLYRKSVLYSDAATTTPSQIYEILAASAVAVPATTIPATPVAGGSVTSGSDIPVGTGTGSSGTGRSGSGTAPAGARTGFDAADLAAPGGTGPVLPRSDMRVTDPFSDEPLMCWRKSYGRGAGKIPDCPSGQENDAGLCYPQCRQGYGSAGPMCWERCPSGYRDDGAFCAKPEPYGRGAGYPWEFGDSLKLKDAKARCKSDNPQGCEKDGAVIYPKCKAGFHAVGCCICSPDCPGGMTDIGVSCAKRTEGRGVGVIPSACPGGENDSGLCYPNCEQDYIGIGPVCWGDVCPSAFPVNCGAGCAKSSEACRDSITDQVVTPLEMVANITGIVVSGGGTAVAGTAARTVAKETIKDQLKRRAKEIGKELAEEAAENAAQTFYEAQLTGEFSWADLDPTGITNVVAAFYQPLCKDYR